MCCTARRPRPRGWLEDFGETWGALLPGLPIHRSDSSHTLVTPINSTQPILSGWQGIFLVSWATWNQMIDSSAQLFSTGYWIQLSTANIWIYEKFHHKMVQKGLKKSFWTKIPVFSGICLQRNWGLPPLLNGKYFSLAEKGGTPSPP